MERQGFIKGDEVVIVDIGRHDYAYHNKDSIIGNCCTVVSVNSRKDRHFCSAMVKFKKDAPQMIERYGRGGVYFNEIILKHKHEAVDKTMLNSLTGIN